MARTGRQQNNVRVSSPRLSINGDIKLRLKCRLCTNVIEGELHEKQARTGVLTTECVLPPHARSARSGYLQRFH